MGLSHNKSQARRKNRMKSFYKSILRKKLRQQREFSKINAKKFDGSIFYKSQKFHNNKNKNLSLLRKKKKQNHKTKNRKPASKIFGDQFFKKIQNSKQVFFKKIQNFNQFCSKNLRRNKKKFLQNARKNKKNKEVNIIINNFWNNDQIYIKNYLCD